jgi:thiamine biosynthesis protein ThiS
VIKLRVNGKEAEAPAGVTVRRFLENKGINPNVVACELNLTILRRANLDQVVLKENDELEIIQMIGGG